MRGQRESRVCRLVFPRRAHPTATTLLQRFNGTQQYLQHLYTPTKPRRRTVREIVLLHAGGVFIIGDCAYGFLWYIVLTIKCPRNCNSQSRQHPTGRDQDNVSFHCACGISPYITTVSALEAHHLLAIGVHCVELCIALYRLGCSNAPSICPFCERRSSTRRHTTYHTCTVNARIAHHCKALCVYEYYFDLRFLVIMPMQHTRVLNYHRFVVHIIILVGGNM